MEKFCFSWKHLASSTVDIRCPTPGEGKKTSSNFSISLSFVAS